MAADDIRFAQLFTEMQAMRASQEEKADKVSAIDKEVGQLSVKMDALDRRVTDLDRTVDEKHKDLRERVDLHHGEVMKRLDAMQTRPEGGILRWSAENWKIALPIVLFGMPVLGTTLVALGESINRYFDHKTASAIVEDVNRLESNGSTGRQ